MTEREQFEAWARVNKPELLIQYQHNSPSGIYWQHLATWEAARAQSSTPNPIEVGTTVQAGQVLSDDEVALIVAECAASAHRQDDFSFARAIEAAVLSKRVPMTEAQINDAYGAASVQHDHIPHDDVARIARAVERHHGIAGKEGA